MSAATKRRRPSAAIAAPSASDEAVRHLEDEVRRQTSWLLRAQDDERRRIARELHDSTAQQLAALLTNLDLVGANATLNPRGRRLLADSINLLEDCAKEIRTISYEVNRKLLSHILSDLGHRAHEADGGAAAIRMARERDYHIILMDLRMPGIDGLKAVEQIRNFGGKKRRPWIVAVTVDIVPSNKAKWRELGMDEVLIKPIRLDDFQTLLGRYLKRA